MARSISSGIAKQRDKVLRTGQLKKFNQIRQRHFWSCYYFTPDANGYIPANTYTLFTTPVGSNGQGFPSGTVISEAESNWKSQNRVPDNQNFAIQELGCAAQCVTFPTAMQAPPAAGMSAFFQSAVLSITYLTNSVPLGLLADFSQSSGPFEGVYAEENDSTNPNIGNTVFCNGFPAPALRRKFKIPILLGAGVSFNFAINVSRPIYMSGQGTGNAYPFLIRVDFYATESFIENA